MLLCSLLNDVSNWLKLGHNPASRIYLEKKQEAAEECGLKGQASFFWSIWQRETKIMINLLWYCET